MFRCFLISDFKYDHERIAFEEIFKNLKNKFSNSHTNFNLIVQPYILSSTPDLIIISNNLIAVADIKSGYGTITGNENSQWFADKLEINKSRENPFQQIHRYKFELLNFLKEKLPLFFTPEFIDSNLNLGHIKGFVVFDGKIFYDSLQLSEATRKWFKVTSSETFHSDIDELPKAQINLSDKDIDILIFKILNLNQSQLIYEYKAISEPIKANAITPRVNIPIKINLPTNLPNFSRIINYFRYCLVLEDLKSSEIPASSIVLELPSSPTSLKEFTISLSPDLKSFLEKQNYYSKAQRIQLLLAFPVISIKEIKTPVFISSLDFTIDNRKNIVSFKISNDFEISKTFISRALGIPDPEQLEDIKSLVDKAKTEEEKLNIIFENINPERAKITKDEFMSAYSSNKIHIFWGNWGTNFKVIKELEELSKKNSSQLSPLLHSFISQTPFTNSSSGEPLILPFSNLNKEQLIAVESAFKKPLTVVTGPPGTGKTQISFNILANAIINGKTVLFSTKNNKAVDDVCKKFDSLFSNFSLSPLMRVGNREVLALIPDKITKTINILNNFIKIPYSIIEKSKNNIRSLKDKIKSIESEIEKFEHLKLTEKTLSDQIEYAISLKEFNINLKLRIINNLKSRKNEILSRIPETFITFFYKKRKTYPIKENAISFHIKNLKDKLSGKLTLFERIILLFNKNYIQNKFLKIFNKLTIPYLEPEQIDYIKKQSTDLISLFNSLLKLKSFESEIKMVFELDKKIEENETTLSNLRKHFEGIIKELNEKLSQIKNKIEALSPKINILLKNLEEYKSRLIEESKNYLLLTFQSSFDSSIIPHLQKFKTAIENQESVSTPLFTNVLKIFPIFATTNQSAANAIPLEREIFDILIIDEASQSDIPSALPLIYRSKNVVIIGDPMQLKHISGLTPEEDNTISSNCQIPSELKLTYSNRSLYSVAEHISNLSLTPVVFLTEHYRSHPDIIKFSNGHFYSHIGKELIIKTPPENLRFNHYQGIFWIHIDGEERNKININEASMIKNLINSLKPLINSDISIGVTTPFRNQADFLQTYLHDILRPDIDVVDTIHRFQGDEKDIMFLSLVVSPSSNISLIRFINQSAKQLLNVAVTRARSCLFVIGNYRFALSKKPTPYDYIFHLAQSSILLDKL